MCKEFEVKEDWQPDYDFKITMPKGYYHLECIMNGNELEMDFMWKDGLEVFDGHCKGEESYDLTEDIVKSCHPMLYEALEAAFGEKNYLRAEQLGNYIGVYLACKEYGYKFECRFGVFYIQSEVEHWRFEPPGTGKVTLFHKALKPFYNNVLMKKDYHFQFHKMMTMQGLVKYINEHEKSKYTGELVDYTFSG